MTEKQVAERIEKLPEEQQRMVLATIRGMELANEANKGNMMQTNADRTA
jgi:hypothetical protein